MHHYPVIGHLAHGYLPHPAEITMADAWRPTLGKLSTLVWLDAESLRYYMVIVIKRRTRTFTFTTVDISRNG